eukprot:CAMPEP_0204325702 /NCGR_PEP_ID=MMETSP0469-20131031/11227_1 /ASSEMBLY_ACC=CAM_ASM_000384 /TAXON_ID=2969 /ORGANISM="Oxyrrhis marina" /LENGTH=714 /DNA_ID=CAMNT_0051307605 /DNA_START=43 /DNA_END=2187 /DNA_ORIENTATION=+
MDEVDRRLIEAERELKALRAQSAVVNDKLASSLAESNEVGSWLRDENAPRGVSLGEARQPSARPAVGPYDSLIPRSAEEVIRGRDAFSRSLGPRDTGYVAGSRLAVGGGSVSGVGYGLGPSAPGNSVEGGMLKDSAMVHQPDTSRITNSLQAPDHRHLAEQRSLARVAQLEYSYQVEKEISGLLDGVDRGRATSGAEPLSRPRGVHGVPPFEASARDAVVKVTVESDYLWKMKQPGGVDVARLTRKERIALLESIQALENDPKQFNTDPVITDDDWVKRRGKFRTDTRAAAAGYDATRSEQQLQDDERWLQQRKEARRVQKQAISNLEHEAFERSWQPHSQGPGMPTAREERAFAGMDGEPPKWTRQWERVADSPERPPRYTPGTDRKRPAPQARREQRPPEPLRATEEETDPTKMTDQEWLNQRKAARLLKQRQESEQRAAAQSTEGSTASDPDRLLAKCLKELRGSVSVTAWEAASASVCEAAHGLTTDGQIRAVNGFAACPEVVRASLRQKGKDCVQDTLQVLFAAMSPRLRKAAVDVLVSALEALVHSRLQDKAYSELLLTQLSLHLRTPPEPSPFTMRFVLRMLGAIGRLHEVDASLVEGYAARRFLEAANELCSALLPGAVSSDFEPFGWRYLQALMPLEHRCKLLTRMADLKVGMVGHKEIRIARDIQTAIWGEEWLSELPQKTQDYLMQVRRLPEPACSLRASFLP